VTDTAPSGSSVASSAVATVKSACACPAGMVTVRTPSSPAARKSLSGASATRTTTDRSAAGAGVAVRRNVSAPPSVTGAVSDADIDTSGLAGVSSSTTCADADGGEPGV